MEVNTVTVKVLLKKTFGACTKSILNRARQTEERHFKTVRQDFSVRVHGEAFYDGNVYSNILTL